VGSTSYSGDNGAATSAGLYGPTGIVFDSNGNFYFSEYSNHRIRKVTITTGIITTYGGTGSNSFSGDNGVATSAEMGYPQGLCIDSAGILTSTYLLTHSLTHLLTHSLTHYAVR
jgi:sugar lactone lactonase YvrE